MIFVVGKTRFSIRLPWEAIIFGSYFFIPKILNFACFYAYFRTIQLVFVYAFENGCFFRSNLGKVVSPLFCLLGNRLYIIDFLKLVLRMSFFSTRNLIFQTHRNTHGIRLRNTFALKRYRHDPFRTNHKARPLSSEGHEGARPLSWKLRDHLLGVILEKKFYRFIPEIYRFIGFQKSGT